MYHVYSILSCPLRLAIIEQIKNQSQKLTDISFSQNLYKIKYTFNQCIAVSKLQCNYKGFYHKLQRCEMIGNKTSYCLKLLRKRRLLGKSHRYKKFGRGFGIGVKVHRKGLVYGRRCKFKKVPRRFFTVNSWKLTVSK